MNDLAPLTHDVRLCAMANVPDLPRRNFTLRMGAVSIKVRWVNTIPCEGGGAVAGEADRAARVIRLARDQNQDAVTAWNTLWHELLHMAWSLSGLESSGTPPGTHSEEHAVSALTTWMAMLVPQNPVLRGGIDKTSVRVGRSRHA